MFDITYLLFWYRKIILGPLGLSGAVQLHHNAEEVKIGTGEAQKSLYDVLRDGCPSLVGHRAWYSPSFWLCHSGHFQTAYSALGDYTKVYRIEYERKFLNVPDGGTICIDIAPPLHVAPPDNRPILVCMHGLTGGSHESYIRSVLADLTKSKEKGGKGWRGIVVNSRGCANGPLKTPKLYHAGATYDLKSAMLYIGHLFPDAPVYGIGFSLGAGMLTKYLGTENDRTSMKAGIVVGSPWNLLTGHIELQGSMRGLFYSKAMAKNLRVLFLRHQRILRQHPDLDVDAILDNPNMTLYEFDTTCTRVCGGFDSAEHYYRSQSSVNFVDGIKVPFLSINALDDPIASAKAVPYEAVERNPNLVLATTTDGGHLGWFVGPFSFWTKRRWVVKPIIEFLEAIHSADPAPRRHPAIEAPKVPKMGDDMVLDPEDPECGFQEVGEQAVMGGDDEGEEATLIGGL